MQSLTSFSLNLWREGVGVEIVFKYAGRSYFLPSNSTIRVMLQVDYMELQAIQEANLQHFFPCMK